MSDKSIMEQLREPFALSELEFLVSRKDQYGYHSGDQLWVNPLVHVRREAITKRFDEVFGVHGWGKTCKPIMSGNEVVGFKVRFEFSTEDKWVCREGIAEVGSGNALQKKFWLRVGDTFAMKRAAYLVGVGDYLHELGQKGYCMVYDVHRNRPDRDPKSNWIKSAVKIPREGGKETYVWFAPPNFPKEYLPEGTGLPIAKKPDKVKEVKGADDFDDSGFNEELFPEGNDDSKNP